MAEQLKGMKGKISFMRFNDGTLPGWGAPPDLLVADVIVKISSTPDVAVGFDVNPGDPHLGARMAMLSSLRHAYLHDMEVLVGYMIEPGRKTGRIVRVEYGNQ